MVPTTLLVSVVTFCAVSAVAAATSLGWTSATPSTVASEAGVDPNDDTHQHLTRIVFIVTPTQVYASGNEITITSSSAIWSGDSTTVACTLSDSAAGSTQTATFAVSGVGTIFTSTLTTTVAAEPLTITCTDNLAPNGAMGLVVTFSAVSTLDTASANATNIGYTIGPPEVAGAVRHATVPWVGVAVLAAGIAALAL